MKYSKVKSECGGKTAYGFHNGDLCIVGQYIMRRQGVMNKDERITYMWPTAL